MRWSGGGSGGRTPLDAARALRERAVRLAGRIKSRKGYVPNLLGGSPFNGDTTAAGRLSFAWKPIEQFSADVIFTADHGELFERGVVGHYCPLIYDPLAHIPLIISPPGRTERVDVQTATSSVDVLPTIARMAGLETPAWAEGRAGCAHRCRTRSA